MSASVEPFRGKRTAKTRTDKRLLEHYRRGGGDRGWYLSLSGEGA